jgi:hypothetical protein
MFGEAPDRKIGVLFPLEKFVSPEDGRGLTANPEDRRVKPAVQQSSPFMTSRKRDCGRMESHWHNERVYLEPLLRPSEPGRGRQFVDDKRIRQSDSRNREREWRSPSANENDTSIAALMSQPMQQKFKITV